MYTTTCLQLFISIYMIAHVLFIVALFLYGYTFLSNIESKFTWTQIIRHKYQVSN
jgi:hypothetical protein